MSSSFRDGLRWSMANFLEPQTYLCIGAGQYERNVTQDAWFVHARGIFGKSHQSLESTIGTLYPDKPMVEDPTAAVSCDLTHHKLRQTPYCLNTLAKLDPVRRDNSIEDAFLGMAPFVMVFRLVLCAPCETEPASVRGNHDDWRLHLTPPAQRALLIALLMRLRLFSATLFLCGCGIHLGVPRSVIEQCRGNEKCITYCADDDGDRLRRRYCKQLQQEQAAHSDKSKGPATRASEDRPQVRVLNPSFVPLSTPEIVYRSMPAIVKILADDNYGTGFAVTDRGFVATNFHVIEGRTEIAVVLPGGRTEQVSHVVAYDKSVDLAILRIPGLTIALPLATDHTPTLGEPVLTIGHPHEFDSTIATGIFNGRRWNEDTVLQWQTTVPMAPGASGGPLIDQHGRVIGIMQAKILDAPHITFAVPVDYLHGLIRIAMNASAPISIAEFAKQTAPPEIEIESEPVMPSTPPVAPEVLKGCSKSDRARIDAMSVGTIEAAKTLCDAEQFAPCAHLYLGAALALEAQLSMACAGPRGMLAGGRVTTLKFRDPEDQAEALRTLFDSLGAGARAAP